MGWIEKKFKEKYKTFIQNILVVIFGLIVALLLVEICFRILPVSDSTKTEDVNLASPFMRFSPNRNVEVSLGKFFEIQTKKKTNKQGFFDDQDFNPTSTKKKIVVIGDSYVEALQVTNAQAIHGQLYLMLGKDWEVNGVGTSGSPLSQYVAYARYVRESLNSEIYIFVIINNDYDQSLLRYKNSPGHHYYTDQMQLVRVDYKVDLLKSFMRLFATARYFVINMKDYSFFRGGGSTYDSSSFAYALPTDDQERILWSKRAVDTFIADISQILQGKKIIFLIDADRKGIYENNVVTNSFSAIMRSYLMEKSKGSKNINVVDLHPIFEESYKFDGKRFEFETDFHWNAHGHNIAARKLANLIYDLDP